MATNVIMPRQGQSVESCIFTEWYKNEGDEIKKGDVLFAYETDKASFEEEANVDGYLLATLVEEGDEVPVLEIVAVIGEKGEDIGELSKATAAAKEKTEPIPEAPKEEVVAEETENIEANQKTSEKLRISPLARKMAQKKGIEVSWLAGTGPNGRIIARDIEAVAEEVKKEVPVKKVVKEPAKTQIIESGEDYEIKPVTNIRKLISKAMHQSLQNSAQLTHHMGADASKLLEFRENVKAAMKIRALRVNVTLNPMICMCVIRALKKHPEVNSHFLGDKTKVFNKVHLGFAMNTKIGLMVPTVKNADDCSLLELTQKIEELSKACIKRDVNPDLLLSEAASFSISNLEGYGVEMFTPVIDLPQVAILGINAIMQRPVDTGNGNIEFRPYIGLSLTYDHRAIDGAPATMFLNTVKEEIENFNHKLV